MKKFGEKFSRERYQVVVLAMLVVSLLLSGCDAASAENFIINTAHIWGNPAGTEFYGYVQWGSNVIAGAVGNDGSGMYGSLQRVSASVADEQWKALFNQGWRAVPWMTIPEAYRTFWLTNCLAPVFLNVPVFFVPLMMFDAIPLPNPEPVQV